MNFTFTSKIISFCLWSHIYDISMIYIVLFLLVCFLGHYGQDCSESCGHCSNLSDCSNVDGTCQTGCKFGYYERKCKKGKTT